MSVVWCFIALNNIDPLLSHMNIQTFELGEHETDMEYTKILL